MGPFSERWCIDPRLLGSNPPKFIPLKESDAVYHITHASPVAHSVPRPMTGFMRQALADDDDTTTGFNSPRNCSEPDRKRQKREELDTPGAQNNENGGRARGYDYMKSAPHKNHSLDLNISVTAVELIALLPHSILSWPIANRLVQNGMTYKLHQYIARRHRAGSVLDSSATIDEIADEDDKLYSVNSILAGYQHAMRAGPDPTNPMADWTRSRHPMLVPNITFDPNNVSLSRVRTRAETHSKIYRPPRSIPLESLATGMKKLPQGADAADLTRAIHFAQQHPGRYFFPNDVEAVVRHIGRVVVTSENTDAACIRRWLPRMQNFRDEASRLRHEGPKEHRNRRRSSMQMSPTPFQHEPAQSSTGPSLTPTINFTKPQKWSPVLEAHSAPKIPQEWIPKGEIAPDIKEAQTFPEHPSLLHDAPDPNQEDHSFRSLCIKVSKHPYLWHMDWPDSSEGLDMVLEYMRDHPAP
ncbi:hypothetical protein BU16DRAFT_576470 [Lophium mytilinum]|uniref:Uncharacterized protein n=1 Tax=Lophium mytilinum TaxID=390894 RepID=A0A6A6RDI7_9PEZI|nr:hypothetical protein BU16DRAFT_576470 [Lophium mytilinum]